MGNVDPACPICVKVGLRWGGVESSRVTYGKPRAPQTSEEILPDTELEETAAHLTDFRGKLFWRPCRIPLLLLNE